MAMTETRNALSCLRCKKRKIRCNRIEPQCDKCQEAGAECGYVPRRARAKKATSTVANSSSDTVQISRDVLENILARLSRLEELERKRYGGSTLLEADQSELSPASENSYSATHHDSPVSLSRLVSEAAAVAKYSLQEYDHNALFSTENHSILRALERVNLNSQHAESLSLDAPIQGPPKLPKDLAEKWLNIFFSVFESICLMIPLEQDYIRSIPQLLELPHISVNNSALIIYYSVIFHGMMADEGSIVHRSKYSTYLYRICLSLARKLDEKTEARHLDLHAAMLMSWLGCEKLDINTAYDMHCKACEIARELGFFTLDAPEPVANDLFKNAKAGLGDTEDAKDQMRLAFWQLQAYDTIFRLHFSKPCAISSGSWQVKFPKFNTQILPNDDDHSFQVNFIVAMRLAYVSRKYFDFKDGLIFCDANTASLDECNAFIDSLVAEIESVMKEWQIERRLVAAKTPLEAWLYADLIFNSQTTAIIFLREKTERNQECSIPPKSAEAARATIAAVRICAAHPISANYSMSFVSLYPIVSVITLFSNALQTADKDQAEADLAQTEWLEAALLKWVKEREELKPVTSFVTALNGVCRQVLSIRSKAAAIEKPVPQDTLGMSNMAGDNTWQFGNTDMELNNLMQDPVYYMRQLESELFRADMYQNFGL